MPNKLPPAKAVRFIQGGYPDSEHDIEKRSTPPTPCPDFHTAVNACCGKRRSVDNPPHTLTGIA